MRNLADVGRSAGPMTRTEWAEQLLRTQILTGQLRPGEWLKLSDLIERYEGLSPTPLREALSRLAGGALVELLPNRGVRVAKASREDLVDVYENRELLETEAFQRSLRRADDTWLDEIRDALDQLGTLSSWSEETVDCGRQLSFEELLRWEEAHRRFHYILIERCGSPWLLRLINTLYEHSVRYRFLTLQTPGSFFGAQHAHEEIFETVKSRDHTGAVQLLREHMKLTVAGIEELPTDGGGTALGGDGVP